ncbi:hypothetical protein [Niastella sp. OAS944]|uniref:hypothetical protein n=1 Tax=Niastella sp. OAS944 TaxID=2664089 RepID=UPI003498E3D1|nr:hypothetical protein [Chitinophagaceae bacterium OAS944]
MATTTFNHTIGTTYNQTGTSVFSRFINWCKGQQENRLIWLGVVVAGHGCVITPLTVLAVVMAGNSLVLFMLAIFAMAISLITNLAALPTKITIPAFALSILIDVGILITAALTSLHII